MGTSIQRIAILSASAISCLMITGCSRGVPSCADEAVTEALAKSEAKDAVIQKLRVDFEGTIADQESAKMDAADKNLGAKLMQVSEQLLVSKTQCFRMDRKSSNFMISSAAICDFNVDEKTFPPAEYAGNPVYEFRASRMIPLVAERDRLNGLKQANAAALQSNIAFRMKGEFESFVNKAVISLRDSRAGSVNEQAKRATCEATMHVEMKGIGSGELPIAYDVVRTTDGKVLAELGGGD